MQGKKTALIILDGWGHGDKTKSDVIYHANTPFIDSLYKDYASPDPNVPYLNPISQSFNNGSFNDWNSWNQLHYVRAIRAF